MFENARKPALRAASRILPSSFRNGILRFSSRSLFGELRDGITDQFLQLMLGSMDTAFTLFPDLRKNIKGFRATYVFRTGNDRVAASAIFDDGDMRVDRQAASSYKVRVTYKDADAFWRFLRATDEDVLESLVKNEVAVDGNANYAYKFAYMSREVTRRLGIA